MGGRWVWRTEGNYLGEGNGKGRDRVECLWDPKYTSFVYDISLFYYFFLQRTPSVGGVPSSRAGALRIPSFVFSFLVFILLQILIIGCLGALYYRYLRTYETCLFSFGP